MYAVIETGGKQYRVSTGDVIDVERLETEGDEISFDRVLMIEDDGQVRVGSPALDGASVRASVVSEVRAPKVIVFKKKRRKGYKRRTGHRQNMLRVEIGEIKIKA